MGQLRVEPTSFTTDQLGHCLSSLTLPIRILVRWPNSGSSAVSGMLLEGGRLDAAPVLQGLSILLGLAIGSWNYPLNLAYDGVRNAAYLKQGRSPPSDTASTRRGKEINLFMIAVTAAAPAFAEPSLGASLRCKLFIRLDTVQTNGRELRTPLAVQKTRMR